LTVEQFALKEAGKLRKICSWGRYLFRCTSGSGSAKIGELKTLLVSSPKKGPAASDSSDDISKHIAFAVDAVKEVMHHKGATEVWVAELAEVLQDSASKSPQVREVLVRHGWHETSFARAPERKALLTDLRAVEDSSQQKLHPHDRLRGERGHRICPKLMSGIPKPST
jgi:hypothetical protein